MGPRSVRVRHRLAARRAAPFVGSHFQQPGLRSGKGLLQDVAPLVVTQHAESLAVWSAVEVPLALGPRDFVVADDASVRRVGVVHRLKLGCVGDGFGLRLELGLRRFVEL